MTHAIIGPSMPEPTMLEELSEEAKLRLKLFAIALLDGAFLLLWVAANHYVEEYIKAHRPEGPNFLVYRGAQILFGIATLVPIALIIYKDIYVMFIRFRSQIQSEELAARRALEQAKNGLPSVAPPVSPLNLESADRNEAPNA
jgi:hypothetical protein